MSKPPVRLTQRGRNLRAAVLIFMFIASLVLAFAIGQDRQCSWIATHSTTERC